MAEVVLRRGAVGELAAGDLLRASDLRAVERVAHPGRRAGMLAARVLTRAVVAEVLGIPVGQVPEETRRCEHCGAAHGPPLLPGSGLRVSVSRSKECVLVACAPEPLRVGVDVEDVPARGLPPAEVVLSPAELVAATGRSGRARRVAGAGGAVAEEAVLQTWVRKEALLKATGRGLAVPPTALTLTPPDRAPRLVAWDERAAGVAAPEGASVLTDLACGPGLIGALAVLGTPEVRVRWLG